MAPLGTVNPKRTNRSMAEDQGGKNDEEVDMKLYERVRDGKGTPEEIARVRAALRDRDSTLWKSLGVSAPFAQMAIERKYRTNAEKDLLIEKITPIAQQNFHRLAEYVRIKRIAGVITEQEATSLFQSLDIEHLGDPRPMAAHYAMSVSRLMKALIKLHPELAAEVRALPISRKK